MRGARTRRVTTGPSYQHACRAPRRRGSGQLVDLRAVVRLAVVFLAARRFLAAVFLAAGRLGAWWSSSPRSSAPPWSSWRSWSSWPVVFFAAVVFLAVAFLAGAFGGLLGASPARRLLGGGLLRGGLLRGGGLLRRGPLRRRPSWPAVVFLAVAFLAGRLLGGGGLPHRGLLRRRPSWRPVVLLVVVFLAGAFLAVALLVDRLSGRRALGGALRLGARPSSSRPRVSRPGGSWPSSLRPSRSPPCGTCFGIVSGRRPRSHSPWTCLHGGYFSSPAQRASSASHASLRSCTFCRARSASAGRGTDRERTRGAHVCLGLHPVVARAPVVLRATSAVAHEITVHRKPHMRHRFTQKVGVLSTVDPDCRERTQTRGRRKPLFHNAFVE